MPDTSPILSLPLIQPAQAQKHVTHNEALRLLDALVQLTVQNRDLFAPPALPAVGDRHIIAAAPTGAWAGNAHRIAVWEAETWAFLTPLPGWQAFVLAEGQSVVWTGTAWDGVMQIAPQVQTLGVNTTADMTNRLAVAAAATLFTHAGAGHQMTLNKAGMADTASLLFQTGWSGRAEIGLAGTDGFSLKVSPDGTAFYPALQADPATGAITLPAGARLADGTAAAPGLAFAADTNTGLTRPGADQIGFATGGVQRALLSNVALQLNVPLTGMAVTQSAADTTAGRLLKAADFGVGGSAVAVTSLNTVVGSGFYKILDTLALAGGAPTAAYYEVLHTQYDANSGKQIAWLAGLPTLRHYERIRSSGIWQPWSEMFHQRNILGTVAQASGVPTGAVIERGSNANGDYLRLADGTQMCWVVVNLTTTAFDVVDGAFFRPASAFGWNFPAVFSVTPAVIPGIVRAGAIIGTTVNAHSATSASVLPWSTVSLSTSAAKSLTITATGRWF